MNLRKRRVDKPKASIETIIQKAKQDPTVY